MSSTYAELQAQIVDRQRELEAKRQAAVDAEQQRKAIAEAPLRAIADTEAQLRQLQRQAVELRWSELAADHSGAIQKQRTLAGEMTAALEKADFMAARELMKQIMGEGQRVWNIRQVAAETMKPLRKEAYAAAWDRRANGQIDEMTLARAAEGDPLVQSYGRYSLPEAPHPYQYLLDWVEAKPEGLERQFRRGLSFAAFGFLGDLHVLLNRFANVPAYGVNP